ncbi:hypothetical protein HDU67_001152 [Dinochytrium kinnereticum]|nr:hypothetical protein HDU67_001152 [Dinochytrium kinnereticum]
MVVKNQDDVDAFARCFPEWTSASYDWTAFATWDEETGRMLSINLDGFSELTGSLTIDLQRLTALKEINLRNNLVTGPIPSGLASLERLEVLYNLALFVLFILSGAFSQSQVSGAKSVDPNNTSVTWIPLKATSIVSIRPQYSILLFGSSFSRAWDGLISISCLLLKRSLDNNQLEGIIPKELGNLSLLECLFLNGNNLSGTLPPELGQLKRLTLLDVNGNSELSGSIPSEYGNLLHLEKL